MFEIEFINYFYFLLLGAMLGSFGNVIIYRMPREESIVKPRSHCFHCKKQVPWYDNIPMVSWFVLLGKCRFCKAPFSFRYVLVEYLMALAFVFCYHQFGFSWFLLEALIFVFGLIVSSFIDFDHMILPDEFTLGGLALGLIGAAINPEREFLPALFGVLLGGGFLWLMAYIYFLITKVEGMGGGDIKLLAWIGAVLGWKAIPFVIMTAAISGSTVGLALTWKQRKGLKTMIPFGPYLAFGAILYLFGGQEIGNWYFHLFLPGL